MEHKKGASLFKSLKTCSLRESKRLFGYISVSDSKNVLKETSNLQYYCHKKYEKYTVQQQITSTYCSYLGCFE